MIRLESLGFLTARETADYLGISRTCLYNWLNDGLLPKPVLEQPGMIIWKLKDIKDKKKKIGGVPYNGNR